MDGTETLPYPSSIAGVPVRVSGILLLQIGFLIFTVVLVLTPSTFAWKQEELTYPCCVLILLHGFWVLWSWKRLRGALLEPYALIFLSALLFNGGQAILEVFGLNRDGLLEGEFSEAHVARVIPLILCGFAALHCGALLAIRGVRRQPPPAELAEAPSRVEAVRAIGWFLLAVSAIPLLILLKEAISTVVSSGYMVLYQKDLHRAGLDSALRILAEFAVPGALLLMVCSAGRKFEGSVGVAVLGSQALILLFLGFRGGSVMPLVAAAWLWDRCVRRLPRVLLTAIAAVVLIGIFPLVRETRMAPGSERRSASFFTNAYSSQDDNPIVSMLAEMGKSMAPLAHTMELVPRERGYDMGIGYAYSLLTVVPSLFWARHPSAARGAAATWLIETIDPYSASQGATIGFSFMAEAYLNFGALGVPLLTLLMGYLVVQFCLWAERGDVRARSVFVAAFLPHLLFFVRQDSTDLPRAFVWYGLAPYVAYLVLERRFRLREQHGARTIHSP